MPRSKGTKWRARQEEYRAAVRSSGPTTRRRRTRQRSEIPSCRVATGCRGSVHRSYPIFDRATFPSERRVRSIATRSAVLVFVALFRLISVLVSFRTFNREPGKDTAEQGWLGMWRKASRTERDPESYGMNLRPALRYRSLLRRGEGGERRRDAPELPAHTRPCNPRP